MMINTAASLHIDRLYNYQSFEKPERLTRIFTERTLYFSKPIDFNDPWDCRPFFNKSKLDDPDEYERTVRWFAQCDRNRNTSRSLEEHLQREQELRANRELLEWSIDQMTSNIERAIQEQYRVYCLSTHPDSTLMWAHYSNSSKGLCLEFAVRNDLFCKALQIEYLPFYPLLKVAEENDKKELRAILTKSEVWTYEDEFRLVASEHPFVFPEVPTTKDGFLPFPKDALKSVIVGPLMSTSDRELVRSIVRGSGWNIALKVASPVPDRYKLEIKMLDL
jgi:hypothetical protein